MSYQQQGQQPQHQNMQDGPSPDERPPPAVPVLQLGGALSSDAAPATGGPKCGRWTLQQLRATEALIPAQYGSNRFASQKKMTGFGSPRDVSGKHLHNLWEEYLDPAEFQDQGQPQQYQGQNPGQPQFQQGQPPQQGNDPQQFQDPSRSGQSYQR